MPPHVKISIKHVMRELFLKETMLSLPPRMKISNSTMIYRKVMIKLNENKTMASMNYFDSSKKNLTYFFNRSQYNTLTIMEMHVWRNSVLGKMEKLSIKCFSHIYYYEYYEYT
jgi:hypothetical protein